jgi:hypothetical protein
MYRWMRLTDHCDGRWIAVLGYVSAAFILIGSGFLDWVLFVFPL